ncbi:GHMP family kinase ATP-binding protein [Nocardioides sp. B-3]|uniref:GHMP family kinase ATP-binding protein n=1 Tax=Nocardioides sp. B-3 TaxID=2895565 RepID=UPI00300DD156
MGQSNIVFRALELIRARSGGAGTESVEVLKSIPVAGGMAGGSADAAATLLAYDRLHHADLPDAALLEIAAELGSDVPFSLVGGTARGRGRGEVVQPLDDRGSRWWVAVPVDDRSVDARGLRALRQALPPRTGRARRTGRSAVGPGQRRGAAPGARPAQRPAGACP